MAALERHYTAKEVAEIWQLSEDTVRALFRDTHGVLKISQSPRRGKRGYVSIRIPESIVLKKHNELHGKTTQISGNDCR